MDIINAGNSTSFPLRSTTVRYGIPTSQSEKNSLNPLLIRIVPIWKVFSPTIQKLTKKIKKHVYKTWCKIYSIIRGRITVIGAKVREDGRKLE